MSAGRAPPRSSSLGFPAGATEVTQSQYLEVMGQNPSRFKTAIGPWRTSAGSMRSDSPTLSEREGLESCYQIRGKGVVWKRGLPVRLRLPTEASGSTRRALEKSPSRRAQLKAVGWFPGNSEGSTQPVARKSPNAWGLYDMSGNVWEWVWEGQSPYSASPQVDPVINGDSESKVHRGGCWRCTPRNHRVSNRFYAPPDQQNAFLGFRVCRSL